MKRILFIWLLVNLTGLHSLAHPVHVSLCNIEIEKNELTLAIKLFRDDFSLALEHNFGKKLDLLNADDLQSRNLIDSYISNMFSISLNKKDTLRLNYQKSEMNEDAIWFYYQSKIPDIQKLDVYNALFLDIYDDQTNLVIVSYNGKQQGYRFNLKHYNEIIELKK